MGIWNPIRSGLGMDSTKLDPWVSIIIHRKNINFRVVLLISMICFSLIVSITQFEKRIDEVTWFVYITIEKHKI
jgi:hypothetical protein